MARRSGSSAGAGCPRVVQTSTTMSHRRELQPARGCRLAPGVPRRLLRHRDPAAGLNSLSGQAILDGSLPLAIRQLLLGDQCPSDAEALECRLLRDAEGLPHLAPGVGLQRTE